MGTQLNAAFIRQALEEQGCPFRIHFRDEVDSTNVWAKQEAGTETNAVFLADHQTAGKGRRGRVWKSPRGTSVSMSILLHPELPPDRLSMLTLVMGMAACEAIRSVCGGINAGIKWPNDVVIDGKKVCGILTEYDAQTESVIIGIGININMEAFPEELSGIATSLRIARGGSPVSREEVATGLILQFMKHYEQFCETCDLSGLRPQYEALLINRGRAVKVLDPAEPFTGTAEGINDAGELLVRRDDTGTVVPVYAGEVSVRGVCGYV